MNNYIYIVTSGDKIIRAFNDKDSAKLFIEKEEKRKERIRKNPYDYMSFQDLSSNLIKKTKVY